MGTPVWICFDDALGDGLPPVVCDNRISSIKQVVSRLAAQKFPQRTWQVLALKGEVIEVENTTCEVLSELLVIVCSFCHTDKPRSITVSALPDLMPTASISALDPPAALMQLVDQLVDSGDCGRCNVQIEFGQSPGAPLRLSQLAAGPKAHLLAELLMKSGQLQHSVSAAFSLGQHATLSYYDQGADFSVHVEFSRCGAAALTLL